MLLKLSTARERMVLMIDSVNHVTGKTGLTLTITASKNGAAFSSISPTVTERGNGWYSLALTESHTDTLGDLALHFTASGADPTDVLDQVVPASVLEVPTATDNAAALLKHDMSLVTGEAARSPLNALRALRNKMTVAGDGTVTVKKEDDSTNAWTAAASFNVNAEPITAIDPT